MLTDVVFEKARKTLKKTRTDNEECEMFFMLETYGDSDRNLSAHSCQGPERRKRRRNTRWLGHEQASGTAMNRG